MIYYLCLIRLDNDVASSKGSNHASFNNNSTGDGYFPRGGFRASAGSRYSDWMGGGVGGSSTQSQTSSFAPVSSVGGSSMSNRLQQQVSSPLNGGLRLT